MFFDKTKLSLYTYYNEFYWYSPGMEQKKELLIKVLEKLQPQWNLAEGILALVKSSYVDEKSIDGVVKLIAEGIKNIKSRQQDEWVQKIQKLEQTHHQRELQDIQDAEDLLKAI